jgi:hypothetical protein
MALSRRGIVVNLNNRRLGGMRFIISNRSLYLFILHLPKLRVRSYSTNTSSTDSVERESHYYILISQGWQVSYSRVGPQPCQPSRAFRSTELAHRLTSSSRRCRKTRIWPVLAPASPCFAPYRVDRRVSATDSPEGVLPATATPLNRGCLILLSPS